MEVRNSIPISGVGGGALRQMNRAETFREQNYTHTLGNEVPSWCGGKGMDKMRVKVVVKDEFSC